MKRIIAVLLFTLVLGTLVACTKKEELIEDVTELEPLLVKLTVTNEVEVGETVHMSSLVTMGNQKIDDADEVVYEVWEEGKKSDSVMIDSTNEKEGVYTAETSFDHDGLFHIQVHVTAKGLHTMPVEQVTVGSGGKYEESSGHDYHTEGFSMHFMKPTDVAAGEEKELIVHVELDELPLE
ncbi:FixH family protein [Sporosarcina pasteurii]|uniref:YtkA-like domain-containing protein n=2 Tax=Sporosarcina pasteurii TaxID=1474 RepID=A0A380C7Y4_SPOPA|nr:FixH family protein [Sporosarcina pasteurii]MDS9473053.1 FixH family protein [Sporosarcina pasteurii]SUJ14172.1 Uncharacterised protein [Sporosarcina pasteurii]